METEVWRDIKGYEGLYQVSNLGNVKSLNYGNRGKEQIMKPTLLSTGYFQAILTKNKIHKKYSVHRLVADAFLSNPDNLPCINHKDENPSNNVVENLEWCTYSYNVRYGNRAIKFIQTRRINDPTNESYKRMIETRRLNYPNNEWCKKSLETRNKLGLPNAEKPVIQYNKDEIEVCRFKSIAEASRQTKIPNSNIYKCCNGKRKTAGGFVWRYI